MEVFARHGSDVPLGVIAEHANLGQTTLYRHFPDRMALLTAVAEVRLDELRAQIAQMGRRPDTFLLSLRALASLAVATSGLEEITRLDGRSPVLTDHFRAAVEDLLEEPLARAKQAKLVSESFQLSDVHAAALMVAAGAIDPHHANAEASLDRAMDLLTIGIGARGEPSRAPGR